MAAVLHAFASYILSMLTKIMNQEVHMLLGVPNEINKMNIKLNDLKRFLADADKRKITDESVQEWVKELQGAMYDVTDILDLCQLQAMERGPQRDTGCFNPLISCMRNPLHAHDIGIRLRNLNEKLEDICKRSATFNFNLTAYEDRRTKIESSRLASRETTGELDKLGLVGEMIEEDTRHFIELLTTKQEIIHGQKKVMVFAIVGIGGIGKTTLAQNIFNNEIIQQEFNKKIWLSVNQDFNEFDLLERAITEAGGDRQAAGNTKSILVRTLKSTLEGYKTLLVMDDVWDHRAWEHVLKSPLINTLGQGSCVLVTTRHDMVARGMMAEEPYHHVNKLQIEDAWSLLKKQIVRNENDEYQVDMLKDIGLGIVVKCDGLPLAVKVMGGLLRCKKIRRKEWENVLNDSTWSMNQMSEEINFATYLSYQDLPSHLKPCFLYFSLLPKSANFKANDIVGMWISEGFVHCNNSRDLEELGRECYDELILRNLIEPNIRYVDQQVCNMHDVVHSFAQYVAKDEALTCHNSKMVTKKLNSQKFIRLSLETKGSESNQLEWMSLQTQKSLRTLIYIGPIMIKPGDSLVTFSKLRTLHVEYSNFDALAKSLIQLKHLRYLAIENCDTSMLPENIGKIKLLQYISLLGCQSLEKLPVSIGKLGHLRFLGLKGTGIKNVPKGFNGLSDLRKLFGFPAHVDGDWCSLEELGSLSNLTDLYIDGLENISSSSFARKARLFEKARLRYLTLSCTSKHGDDGPLLSKVDENITDIRRQRIKEVFDELSPPPGLEHLLLNGYFGQQLPKWMMSTILTSLESLRILMMENLPYCIELPDSMYQLPYLEFLQIQRASTMKGIGPEFVRQQDNQHPTSALENLGSGLKLEVIQCAGLERISNIPKVQELTINKCPMLKVLEGMSVLQKLVLEDYNMKTLPGYLQHLKLRYLLVYCDVWLLISVAAGESSPEWNKFSHIKQVKVYTDDDDNNIEEKLYVVYTKDPFRFNTNFGRSVNAQARRRRVGRLPLPNFRTYGDDQEEGAVRPLQLNKGPIRCPYISRGRTCTCNVNHHIFGN